MPRVYVHTSDTLIPARRGEHIIYSNRKKIKGYSVTKEIIMDSKRAKQLIGPDCDLKWDVIKQLRESGTL